MNSVIMAGGLQRMVEVVFEAAPTILVGLLVAGVIRNLIGYEKLRSWLGGGLISSLLKAWVAGMLLPVCSLGVLPILREMQKAGVRGGTIMAFGLTAPLFNPISVLYGLTLADPTTLLVFCLGSLTVVTALGAMWTWLFPEPPEPKEKVTDIPVGIRRLVAIANSTARGAVDSPLAYSVIAILGAGILAMVLPAGRLQLAAEADDPLAPLFMATMAVPAYAAPMTVMMQLSSMFQHGNSVGAAFTLLVLGAGVNAGLLVWLFFQHRSIRTVIALASLFALVVAIGYALDKPLYPRGIEPTGHTHAFDGYCNPFHEGEIDAWGRMVQNLKDAIQPFQIVGLGGLIVCLVAGIGLKMFDRDNRIEAWLAKTKEEKSTKYDVIIPGPILGIISLLGLIAASIFACYLYYPPREEILKEMRFVHTEVFAAANSGQFDTALYWIPVYEDWTRKLLVSEYLRGRPVSPYLRTKVKVLGDRLEALEHACEDGETEECKEMTIPLNRSFARLKEAIKAQDEPNGKLATE